LKTIARIDSLQVLIPSLPWHSSDMVSHIISKFFLYYSLYYFHEKHLGDSMKVNMNLKGRHQPFSTVSYLLGFLDVKKPARFKLKISDTVYIRPKLIEIWKLSYFLRVDGSC